MSYPDHVSMLIDAERKAALREGDILVPGHEGVVAGDLLYDLLKDEAIIREVITEIHESDANDVDWDDVVAVLNALRRVLEGDRG